MHFEQMQPGSEPDVFDFWKTSRLFVVSALQPLARMYLSFPSSTADTERSFSSAGFLYEGRERLLPCHLEAQVVIRDYLLTLRRGAGDNEEEYIAQVSALLDRLPDHDE